MFPIRSFSNEYYMSAKTNVLSLPYALQKEYAKESGDLAGEHRRFDVYMGVDVFGRNTYGGGGYQVMMTFPLLYLR